jgi:hypothetical protein
MIVSGVIAMGITPGLSVPEMEAQALSDRAIDRRVELALAALRPPTQRLRMARKVTHA